MLFAFVLEEKSLKRGAGLFELHKDLKYLYKWPTDVTKGYLPTLFFSDKRFVFTVYTTFPTQIIYSPQQHIQEKQPTLKTA